MDRVAATEHVMNPRTKVTPICRADKSALKWPLERDGKSQQISVDGRVIVDSPDLAIQAALDGLGIAYTLESLANVFLRSGQLVRVLEDWSPSFEGSLLSGAAAGAERAPSFDRHDQGDALAEPDP